MTDKETQVRITCAVMSAFTFPPAPPTYSYLSIAGSVSPVCLKLNTLLSSI